MPRDILSTAQEDSMMLRSLEILRRRKLIALVVFATVLGVGRDVRAVSAEPLQSDGGRPRRAPGVGNVRANRGDRRAREPPAHHQAGDPEPRAAHRS